MPRKLLITDDAPMIREMVKKALAGAGWEIVGEAANGQQAIDQFRDLRPHAVTLDMMMPEFDGMHALRGIRELDPTATVVVVSAIEQTAVLKEAIEAGASDFIVKPFDKQLLVETLDKLVPDQPAMASEPV